VIVAGVPTVSGADGRVDEVQGVEVDLKAWSMRSIASWSEAEERLEKAQASVCFSR
jgi:hypothetical protein